MQKSTPDPAPDANRRRLLDHPGARCIPAIALNAIVWAVLVYAASHVHVDRTNRQPVVTWIGPAASWGPHLGEIVFTLVCAAFLSSMVMVRHRFTTWEALAFLVSLMTLFAAGMIIAVLYED